MASQHAGIAARSISNWVEWPTSASRVQQSANITLSGIISSYQYVGGLIHAHFYAVCTSAGSAGTAISLLLPVAASAAYAGHGSITFVDSGTGRYHGGAVLTSTTVANVAAHGLTGYVGATPNFAIANGDEIIADLIYRPA